MKTMPSRDASRPLRASARKWMAPALIAALLLLVVGVASASAASSIEGIWKFAGGEIGVHEGAGGKLEGTVVQATDFDECVHPVGQAIWTDMALQPDGSYQGFHQWYFANSGCKENPELGPTAWRVLEENGKPYLLVCLSNPGTTQPTIAPNGTSTGVTYKCIPSEHTAELPTTGGGSGSSGSGSGNPTGTGEVKGEIVEHLTLPGTKQCLSGRRFEIHLAEPKLDPFKTVTVTLQGHKIATKHRGNFVVATISLAGLKRGKFTIAIHATTVLGHHLSGTRTYHTCSKTPKHSKPSKLR
jgi:hypothetical protein